MTDLAEIAAELLPGARWLSADGDRAASARTPGRPIAWVRVMRARVPAFDALDSGDLVIAPSAALAVVAPDAAELRQFVSALARVPVAGLLLVEGEGAVPEPADLGALAAALDEAGLPALRVPRTDLGELERALVGFIVGRGAELERQATLLEAELRRRALEGGGVTALMAAVSGFLGRAMALEAGRGEPLVVHAPVQAPAAAASAARYQRAADESVVAHRVALPGGAAPGPAGSASTPGRPGGAGSLVVLGSEPASDLARITLPRVAGLIALELAREDAVRGATDRARRAEPMPGAGPPWVMILARQRESGPDDDGAAAREHREDLRRALRLLAPARRLALRGDADSIEVRLVAAGAGEEATRLAQRVGEVLQRPVALSRPFSTAAERPAAEAAARATLEAALELQLPPPVADAARLAIYRMLGAVHKLPDGPRLAHAVLEPLLDARPDVRRERLQTLRAVLAAGTIGEAAAALGVHRNTIAYRVRGIEAATGWRLADPALRLPLATALELVQDEQV